MNIAVAQPSDAVDTEQAARVELAALYRLVDFHYGCGEGIYNHISLRVPGEPDQFLVKDHGLLFREVTASNLIKADLNSFPDESSGVNWPGFILHSAVLRARPDVNCVVHMHTNVGLAMSARPTGLRMMSQNALRFYGRVGYHAYEGITDDISERERLAEAIGGDRIALFLRNHGVVTFGAKARDAFEYLRDLVIACETQLTLESAGGEILEIAPEICEKVAQQYKGHDKGRGAADWPAWVRLMDAQDPSFRH
jgi:ribulose-5-phosphate 4-epimerase/fuculose-1-phosphate aldolase